MAKLSVSLSVVSSIFLAAIAITKEAQAIIFIPPVIYIATLSIASFLTNIGIFIVFWLAVKGIVDRSYFGKPAHEIVHFVFKLLGRIIILIFSAVISIIILNPLNTKEIFFSSLAAGVLGLTVLFLDNFREYRLARKSEKISFFKSIALFSTIVCLVTFISAFFALETKILSTESKEEYKEAPIVGFSPKMEEDIESSRNDYYVVKKLLLFYPQDLTPCRIYFENILLLTVNPSQNCYYYKKNNQAERIICPVRLAISDIQESLIQDQENGDIHGEGSCFENYSVILDKNGFSIQK